MNKFLRPTIFLLVLTMASCGGGGGGGNGNQSVSLNGKVIDDYIKNAKVVVDINKNGKCDDGEPYTYTNENGEFNLTIDSKYANYPLVACVNEDVQSEFANGTPVQGKFAFHSVEGNILSPFSDIVYGYLKDHPESSLEEAKSIVSTSLGISPEEINSDYIKENKKHLSRIAQILGELYGNLTTDNQNLDYNQLSITVSSYARFHGAEILTGNVDTSDIDNIINSINSKRNLHREIHDATWLIGKTIYSITEDNDKAMLYKLTFNRDDNGNVKVNCGSIEIQKIGDSTDITSINGSCRDYDWGNLTWKIEGNKLIVEDETGGAEIDKVICYSSENPANVTLTLGEIFEEWENDLRDLGVYNETTSPVNFQLNSDSAICNIKIKVYKEDLGTMVAQLPESYCAPLPSEDTTNVKDFIKFFSADSDKAWKDPEYDNSTLPANISGTVFQLNTENSGSLLLKKNDGTLIPYGKFWIKEYNGNEYIVMDRGPFNYGYSPYSPGEGRLLGIIETNGTQKYCVEDYLYQDVPEEFNWYTGSVAKEIASKIKEKLSEAKQQ